MAQHDYDVANGTGLEVRTDLNNLFDAIASNNGGSSAPATTFPNMWWFDEANDLLKQRNKANSAWVTVASKTASGWVPYSRGSAIDKKLSFVDGAEDLSVTLASGRLRFQQNDAADPDDFALWEFLRTADYTGAGAGGVASNIRIFTDVGANAGSGATTEKEWALNTRIDSDSPDVNAVAVSGQARRNAAGAVWSGHFNTIDNTNPTATKASRAIEANIQADGGDSANLRTVVDIIAHNIAQSYGGGSDNIARGIRIVPDTADFKIGLEFDAFSGEFTESLISMKAAAVNGIKSTAAHSGADMLFKGNSARGIALDGTYTSGIALRVASGQKIAFRTGEDRTLHWDSSAGAFRFNHNVVANDLRAEGGDIRIEGSSNLHLWFRESDGTNRGIVWHNDADASMNMRNYDYTGTTATTINTLTLTSTAGVAELNGNELIHSGGGQVIEGGLDLENGSNDVDILRVFATRGASDGDAFASLGQSNSTSYLQAGHTSSGNGLVAIRTTLAGSVGTRLVIEADGDTRPGAASSHALGTSSFPWLAVVSDQYKDGNNDQVVTSRQTGWGAPTGTADRTAFDTSTVTTEELAQRVKALVDDLTTHGLVGA